MQKVIFIFTLFVNFIFSDILLDRINTEPYKVCPISKKYRKRFFLMEIRELKKLNKTVIYIFEKQTNKDYKFIYGFHLDFLGKEIYFQGYKKEYYKDVHGTDKIDNFKRSYFYWCKPKTKYYSGNFIILIGNSLSKEEMNNYIKKRRIKFNNSKIKRKKSNFYARKRILLFIPENKQRKSFFTSLLSNKFSSDPFKWIENKNKNLIFFLSYSQDQFIGFELPLSGYPEKIIGLTSEQRKFRDKYYFDLKDLQKQGIPEPTPMWDAKVKPYKNVFGEELLD